MVCILKKPCDKSPGLMFFSHNEYIYGGLASHQNRQLLVNAQNDWHFGLHINGDCSFLKEWPDLNAIDYIMWPNINEPFLHNVKQKVIPKTCVHFYPEPNILKEKIFDISITSHAAEHKNFDYSIKLIKSILTKRPSTTVVILAMDPREHKRFSFFKKKTLYFDKIKEVFTSKEMHQISFVSPSSKSFGSFPLASNFYWAILSLSKTTLLTSLLEGTPRCVVESIIHQTMPCIMKELKSGLKNELSDYDLIRLDNQSDEMKIINYLDGPLYEFNQAQREKFLFEKNWPDFINSLNKIKGKQIFDISHEWINHNLNNRLPGHLKSKCFQLMDEKTMKKYLNNVFSGSYEINELY